MLNQLVLANVNLIEGSQPIPININQAKLIAKTQKLLHHIRYLAISQSGHGLHDKVDQLILILLALYKLLPHLSEVNGHFTDDAVVVGGHDEVGFNFFFQLLNFFVVVLVNVFELVLYLLVDSKVLRFCVFALSFNVGHHLHERLRFRVDILQSLKLQDVDAVNFG